MRRIYHIEDEEAYNEKSEESMLEKAFKEGCEHGYAKAIREYEGDRRVSYKEGFEEKLEKLKRKYK